MHARLQSFTLVGIEAVPVEVQVSADSGYPVTNIVGLPDKAVRESLDRIYAAFKASDCAIPRERITVNLAPAELRKEGAAFDLAIALGILAAMKAFPAARVVGLTLAGELALDGEIRPVRGALAMALACVRLRRRILFLPEGNLPEASDVPGVSVRPVRTLRLMVERLQRGGGFEEELNPRCAVRRYLPGTRPDAPSGTVPPASGEAPGAPAPSGGLAHLAPGGLVVPGAAAAPRGSAAAGASAPPGSPGMAAAPDFAEVRGQPAARRALEIAAAGGHNLLMVGPPGAGKTLLAQRLPGILPPLDHDEALEVTLVHSVAGLLRPGVDRVRARPFRAPHHTVSAAGLVGGGAIPRPGEVSLAHCGVLFLDEMPEFRPPVLNLLRQPLEEGQVRIVRSGRVVSFPCRFMLVGAMNPCPCGFLGHPRKPCRCTPHQIKLYRNRIGGPLLDRIDLHIEVPSVTGRELLRKLGRGGGRYDEGLRPTGEEAEGSLRTFAGGERAGAHPALGGGPELDSAAGDGSNRHAAIAGGADDRPPAVRIRGNGRHLPAPVGPDPADGPLDSQDEGSAPIRLRVEAARRIQNRRFSRRPGIHCNAQMGLPEIEEFCRVDETTRAFLQKAVEALSLSARSAHRSLRVARTIADLAGEHEIALSHVAEAVQYQVLDRGEGAE